MPSGNLPLIDIDPALSGNADDAASVAREIDTVCREFGFFRIRGHGVDPSLIAALYDALSEFFALPLEEKRAKTDVSVKREHGDYTPYGYSAVLTENSSAYMGDYDQPADYVEKLSIGNSIRDDNAVLPLPADNPQLRRLFKEYYNECDRVARVLAGLTAVAFGMPATFFQNLIDRSRDSMRAHHYPSLAANALATKGMGAHVDGSLFTLLTETADGLEVRLANGEWLPVRTDSLDHFVVNIGDLMMKYVDDQWKSTEHRVVRPVRERQSIVFFKLMNEDAPVGPMEGALREGTRPSETVPYGQYVEEKMYKTYQ